MNQSLRLLAGAGAVMCAATVAIAQQMTVDINKVSESGVGEKIGTVTVTGG